MNILIQDDKHIYSFLLVSGIEWVIFVTNVNPSHPRDPRLEMGQEMARQTQTRPGQTSEEDRSEYKSGTCWKSIRQGNGFLYVLNDGNKILQPANLINTIISSRKLAVEAAGDVKEIVMKFSKINSFMSFIARLLSI